MDMFVTCPGIENVQWEGLVAERSDVVQLERGIELRSSARSRPGDRGGPKRVDQREIIVSCVFKVWTKNFVQCAKGHIYEAFTEFSARWLMWLAWASSARAWTWVPICMLDT